MSKAEDLALKTYPVVMTTLIPADEEHPLIEQDCNKFIREAYIKGYEQAEKDLEQGWEDIRTILDCFIRYKMEIGWNKTIDEDDCAKEVLKRFKNFKEREEI